MPVLAKRISLVSLVLTLITGMPPTQAQASNSLKDTLNVLDANGRRQGWWRFVAPTSKRPGYPDGALVEEGRFRDNKRVGLWRRYWPNGRLMSEVTYEMGRPRGQYTTYYRTGKVEEHGHWDLDRNTGAFKRYHPNGQVAQDFIFDTNGVRNGDQKYYHDNGELAVQVHIREGREEGLLKRFDASGQLTQQAEFNNGVINAGNSRWIKPVPKAEDLRPAPDAAVAPVVSADEKPNAVPFRETGWNTLYDGQLRISQQGDFVNGRLSDGRVYVYDKDGLLSRIKVYKNGRYTGDAVITPEDLQ